MTTTESTADDDQRLFHAAVRGALTATIKAHGPVDLRHVESVSKRLTGQLIANAHTRRMALSDAASQTAAHEWFEARREQVGTHMADCWQYHPDCAYWFGRYEERMLALANIEVNFPPCEQHGTNEHKDCKACTWYAAGALAAHVINGHRP